MITKEGKKNKKLVCWYLDSFDVAFSFPGVFKPGFFSQTKLKHILHARNYLFTFCPYLRMRKARQFKLMSCKVC